MEDFITKNNSWLKMPFTNKNANVVSNSASVQDGPIEVLIEKLYDGTTDGMKEQIPRLY